MPDKINIYRLYDPIDIQLMKIDIEAAAAKVPTGDFLPGYMECTVFDNGFWTLENTMPPISGLGLPSLEGQGVGSIDDARNAADKWMKAFDEILQGKQPANAYQNTAAHQQMMAAIHPQYRDAYQAKPAKAAKQKPKFFENIIYVNGLTEKVSISGNDEIVYKLIYRCFLKPSKEMESIGVIGFLCCVELWNGNIIKSILCNFLPVKSVESERRFAINSGESETIYKYIKSLNMVLPFYN